MLTTVLLGSPLLAQQVRPEDTRFEFTDSSVLGRNFNAPDGTPRAGHGPVGELQLVLEGAVFFEELPWDGHRDGQTLPVDDLEGQTFLGFLAPLRLRYRSSEEFTVELGATLAQNFGDDDSLDGTEPLVRVILEPWKGVYAIAGTIFPTHPMHDALLWNVHAYQDATEEGVQFRVDRDAFRDDLWLDWQVREGDDHREEFNVGNVTEVDLGPVRVEGELLWFHAGGQRNDVEGVENSVATALGMSLGLPLDGDAAGEEVRLGVKGFRLDESGDRGHLDGGGVEVRGEVVLWFEQPRFGVRPFVSHFEGHDLHTRDGNPQYQQDHLTQAGVELAFPFPGGGLVRVVGAGLRGNGELDWRVGFAISFGESFRVPLSRVEPPQ